ncbi:hypothetical protein BH11BAC2_BH11BAC2_10470 [soil metagenome]
MVLKVYYINLYILSECKIKKVDVKNSLFYFKLFYSTFILTGFPR